MMQRLAFVLSFLIAMTAAYHLPFSNQHLNILQRNRMPLGPLEAVRIRFFLINSFDPTTSLLQLPLCKTTIYLHQ